MTKKLFIDIGNIYTKYLLLDQLKENPEKKGFFLSAVSIYPPPIKFFEFEEKIYFDIEQASKCYLVGWPAALVTTHILGMTLDIKHFQLILFKVLFDNFQDGDSIEVYLTYDAGENASCIQDIANMLSGKEIKCFAKCIFEDEKHQKKFQLKVHAIARSLSLFEYYRSSASPALDDKYSMLIVELGYMRSKASILSNEKGLESFSSMDVGTKIIYDHICVHFRELKLKVNPFMLMQELELNYPLFTVDQEKYDLEKIIKDVCWDLNKDLIQSISVLLKDYYSKHGNWPDELVITGGGSVFMGDLLLASLSERDFTFTDVIIDKSPRYSVLNGIPLLLQGKEEINHELHEKIKT